MASTETNVNLSVKNKIPYCYCIACGTVRSLWARTCMFVSPALSLKPLEERITPLAIAYFKSRSEVPSYEDAIHLVGWRQKLLPLLLIHTKPIDIAKCRQWDLQSQSTVALLDVLCLAEWTRRRRSSALRRFATHLPQLWTRILECGDRRSAGLTASQSRANRLVASQSLTHTAEHQLQLSLRDRIPRNQTTHFEMVDCYWYYYYYYYCCSLLLPTTTYCNWYYGYATTAYYLLLLLLALLLLPTTWYFLLLPSTTTYY